MHRGRRESPAFARLAACAGLLLAAWSVGPVPFATAGPDESAVRLSEIERGIADADSLAVRRKFVHDYLDLAAAQPPVYELNAADRDRVAEHTAAAAEKQVELVPLVGRYVILLCPPEAAAVARERGYVSVLDASYILLRHLFGFDPVEAKGYRILHRYDFNAPRGAHSNWSRLDCRYGREDWREWVGPPIEWPGNPIHEMTHCFAGNSPARFAIESLPGSGEGWPKWTPLYVYRHMPDDAVLKRARTKHRREYVDALKNNFKKSGGDFWSIAPYDPAGGLLVLLAEASADEKSSDPFAPIARTLSDLNRRPDPLIETQAPLELLRFIAALERHADPAFWGVLRRYSCRVNQEDTKAYRRWAEEIAPRIGALAASSLKDAPDEPRRILEMLRELDSREPFIDALHEQAATALAQRMSELGFVDQARQAAGHRRRLLNWSLLGPFHAATVDAGMQAEFILETASSPAAAIAGRDVRGAWRDEPGGNVADIHDFGPIFGRREGDVAYAWTTIHVPTQTRLWAFLSGDDQCRAWLNGRPVGGLLKHGGISPNTSDFIRLDLKPGENVLLIKVANAGGPWGFFCRLTPDLSCGR